MNALTSIRILTAAAAALALPAASQAAIVVRATPVQTYVYAGLRVPVSVAVANTGPAAVSSVRVCVKLPRSLGGARRCFKAGTLAPETSAAFTVRARVAARAARGRSQISIKATSSGGAASGRAPIVVLTRDEVLNGDFLG